MVIGLTFLSFCFFLVSFFGYPPSLAPPPPLSVHPPVLRSVFFFNCRMGFTDLGILDGLLVVVVAGFVGYSGWLGSFMGCGGWL